MFCILQHLKKNAKTKKSMRLKQEVTCGF